MQGKKEQAMGRSERTLIHTGRVCGRKEPRMPRAMWEMEQGHKGAMVNSLDVNPCARGSCWGDCKQKSQTSASGHD